MKVFYHQGSNWRKSPPILVGESNMLSLSFNNWDDYGVSTTLNAVLYIDGSEFMEFSLKLLIEGDIYSPKKLNELRDEGWDGYFPIPKLNYVTLPSDINFYSAILGKLGEAGAKSVLGIIRDAGYLKNIVPETNAVRLIEHKDFSTSLLREGGARKAYSDGWRVLEQASSGIDDFTLYTRRYDGTPLPISFKFNSDILPYDINILIGPNGIGKSYTLKSLVEYWLGVASGDKDELEKVGHIPFDDSPNISKLILISYSPFEEFAVDLSGTKLLDKDAYKYFGFRQTIKSESGEQRIGISRNLPASDSVNSLIKAFSDDTKFGFLPNWIGKIDSIYSVLQESIGFDKIAVEVISPLDAGDELINFVFESGEKNYLPLTSSIFQLLMDWEVDLENAIDFQAGVVFLRDDKKYEISSGQRLFLYIVLNVVGQIRPDSLIVIDEPELFLHPTLEIEFIALLKKVLEAFNSKAILATHSLAIAREVPANCVQVYKSCEDVVEVDHPPFETFGADMQRISSYVFGDNGVNKPFDEWLSKKLKEVDSQSDFIQKLGNEINEELLIKILNSGGK